MFTTSTALFSAITPEALLKSLEGRSAQHADAAISHAMNVALADNRPDDYDTLRTALMVARTDPRRNPSPN